MEPTSTKLVDTLRDWKSLGRDKGNVSKTHRNFQYRVFCYR